MIPETYPRDETGNYPYWKEKASKKAFVELAIHHEQKVMLEKGNAVSKCIFPAHMIYLMCFTPFLVPL